MSLNITACPRCSGPVTEAMRFCPLCGRRLVQKSQSFRAVLIVGAVALFGVGYGLQSYLIPPKPIQADKQHSEHPPIEENEDPQIAILREELERDPTNMEKLKMMAGMLGDTLRSAPQPASSAVFEAIDVLSRILAISPNDPGALVMMADVSFDQRAFTKAKEFYEKYLVLEPSNHGARARYASTLTFLGDYDKSISQLQEVLKADPKNFPAMAYLSITYAQRGDIAKAREFGTTALGLAPSDEAKARFSAFMSSLDSTGAGSGPVPAGLAPSAPAPAQAQVAQSSPATGIEAFVAKVKANPVAGPKFVNFEDAPQGELKLFFRDFPMSQMPPFAKEKFFGSLRQAAEAAKLTSVKSIIFVDLGSGATMDRIALAKG